MQSYAHTAKVTSSFIIKQPKIRRKSNQNTEQIKNKIRKPLFHLFIINIYSKHEAETGERNIVLTLRKLLSLCEQIMSISCHHVLRTASAQ